MYICQCYSLTLTQLPLPPLCPQVHSLHLHLYSCPVTRFISTVYNSFSNGCIANCFEVKKMRGSWGWDFPVLYGLFLLQNDLEWTIWLLPEVSLALSHFQGFRTPGSISSLDDPSNICVSPATSGILTGIMAQGSTTLENWSLQPLMLDQDGCQTWNYTVKEIPFNEIMWMFGRSWDWKSSNFHYFNAWREMRTEVLSIFKYLDTL